VKLDTVKLDIMKLATMKLDIVKLATVKLDIVFRRAAVIAAI